MSVLAERLLAVHVALARARIPHAFGGAIALAYCTEEPRGTRDLDVNVFVDVTAARSVFAALPDEMTVSDADIRAVERDGQVRVWWEDTPVDVFFDVHTFHRYVAGDVRIVPFAGAEIPVLGCTSLAVFKAIFNRTKDWADIEAMEEVAALDAAAVLGWLVQIIGADDPRTRRLGELAR